MKVIAIALACFVASISALPNQQGKEIETAIRSGDQRLVTGSIVQAIEDAAQSIRDAGLDPLIIDREEFDYALPVPTIFNIKSGIAGFLFRGLSNIIINRMTFTAVSSRLRFEIELPQIETRIGLTHWDAKFFDGNINGAIGGRLAINNIVINGDVRVSVGIISGVSIRSLDINFRMRSIESELNVVLQGWNVSGYVNNYLGEHLPGTMRAYENDIDQLISIIAKQVADAIL